MGERPVGMPFSLRAAPSVLTVKKLWYWALWQPPQSAGSSLVTGLTSPLLSTCLGRASWQVSQASLACFEPSLSAFTSSWQP